VSRCEYSSSIKEILVLGATGGYRKISVATMRNLIFACLALVTHAGSLFDSDCISVCKLVGGCPSGSYCKSNGTCHGLFNYKDGLCLFGEGYGCPTTSPLLCKHARILNPDLACARLLSGSYCKVNSASNARVCQGIGRGFDGSPCRIGRLGCRESRPFSCDYAIIMRAPVQQDHT
jgi:hypothetical protein